MERGGGRDWRGDWDSEVVGGGEGAGVWGAGDVR